VTFVRLFVLVMSAISVLEIIPILIRILVFDTKLPIKFLLHFLLAVANNYFQF